MKDQQKYLSKFLCCTRCGKGKAEYTLKNSAWDIEYICEECAEYIEFHDEIVWGNLAVMEAADKIIANRKMKT